MRGLALSLSLLGALASGCHKKTPPPPPPEMDAGASCGCAAYGQPQQVGTVDERLRELSGLAALRTRPGLFIAHNDSGDEPRVFVMKPSGEVVAERHLADAGNVDWEDIAVGPCPEGSCVVVADFGDNRKVRTDYALYRFPEAALDGEGAIPAVKLPFSYPGGVKYNAEALVIHPTRPLAYLITKVRGAPSEVYRLSLTAEGPQEAEKITTMGIPLAGDLDITAADVSPCGGALAVRMYNRVAELRLEPGQDFEQIFTRPDLTMPTPVETQGEAVAYPVDGMALYTASEKATDPVPVYRMSCIRP